MIRLLKWCLKSKGVKVGGSVVGGSSAILLIMALHSDVTAKINKQEIIQKEYVQLTLKPIEVKIQHLKDGQKDIKKVVESIRDYLLKEKVK